ncbi:MAG: ribonuclease HII [Clostridia bacterium]|nr:ribonuclease HII [Clostridia bacterium]
MPDYEYEAKASSLGFVNICGVDEAGRGTLAGPVYAAAVILPQGLVIEGLNDSKKLSEKKRELLYDKVIESAVAWSVGTATEQEIDEINILQATYLAMKRAVEGLPIKADFALIDGNRMPPLDIDGETVIKGDSLSMSIAAASIIAKVTRDRFMLELDEKYPEYLFAKHKGYGTALHYEMLEKHGISPVHRRSFLKKLL